MAYDTTTRPPGSRPPRSSGSPWAIALGVIAAVAAVWLIWAWVDDDEDALYQDQVAEAPLYEAEPTAGIGEQRALEQNEELIEQEEQAGASVESIAENPERFVGQTVTLQAEVGDQVGARGFRIEADDPLFDEELLVLSTRGMAPFDDDDRVSVTGTVRMFNQQAFETEYGIDLEDDLFADLEGQPVVIAEQVQRAATARAE